jgi:two-component system response regulator FixJ
MDCNPIIHVIDDDHAQRNSLNMLLHTEGYAVKTYALARTFLEAVHEGDMGCIGCIVTDVQMPEMSGLDLLDALNERGVLMPTIVMTGNPTAYLMRAAASQGAFAFFEKPVDPDALLAAIRTALGRDGD